MKLLTIGNSFTWSLRSCFPPVCESAGVELDLEFANHGGCELSEHWAYVCAEENEPECRMYQDYAYKLREVLAKKPWDVVTIQQASHLSWDYDTFLPYADLLIGYVRKHAPGAEIVIQQTWSYREDAPRLAEWGFPSAEMHRRLTEAYRKLAEHTGLRMISTGAAVDLARREQPVKFENYDPALLDRLRWPDLPPQAGALVGKCFWRKNAAGELELVRDTIHLNLRGEYLQACVWFGFLFGRDPREITYVPPEVSDSDASFLRDAASHSLSA